MHRKDVNALALQFLGGTGAEIVDVMVQAFEDDVQAHDDDLQSRLEDEFVAEWSTAKEELVRDFGEPIEEGATEATDVPLNGILRFAKWQLGGRVLYLAASHEDRECPYLLMLGITAD